MMTIMQNCVQFEKIDSIGAQIKLLDISLNFLTHIYVLQNINLKRFSLRVFTYFLIDLSF